MQEIYFDNASTTRVDDAVIAQMTDVMKNEYGNPSSLHSRGVSAQLRVERARRQVETALGMKEGRLFFTSGGTESNCLAILGAAEALRRRGDRVILSALEHASVLTCGKELERRGFHVTVIPSDREGRVSLEALEDALDDRTILVSLMLVNNEVGTVQPVAQAARLVHARCPQARFHTDAVQAFGKIPFRVGDLGVDLLSLSGHKIHAPKGVGALYAAPGVRLIPLLYGGGQQEGIRPGTESVPLIAALGVAAHEAQTDLKPTAERLGALRKRLLAGLAEMDAVIHTPAENVSPFIFNFSVPGFRSETILHFLAQRNIFVSSGSACSKGARSHVLSAMGCPEEEIDSALRLSFSKYSTPQEADAFLESLREALRSLRRAR